MATDAEPTAGPLVMVIDDDEDIRVALVDILESEGYRVVTAGNGRAALGYLSQRELPQLILLDLMMPDVNGWQFRAEQMMNPALASIPVIVITAAGLPNGASDLGAEVISKPFDVHDVVAAVRRHGIASRR